MNLPNLTKVDLNQPYSSKHDQIWQNPTKKYQISLKLTKKNKQTEVIQKD